jgi:DNA invertase Pin-like site-specific DNA recombinase
VAIDEADKKTQDIFQSMNTKKVQVIGYVRVSTTEQNIDRQLADIELDKVFVDKISGTTKTRPELNNLLNYVREGDIVLIHSLDRLSRKLDFLIDAVNQITAKGVTVKFIKENLTFNPMGVNPMDKLIFQIFGALAEWQRENMKQAQREGIDRAKKRGTYKGRSKALKPSQVKELKDNPTNLSKKELCEKYSISIATLYRYLK